MKGITTAELNELIVSLLDARADTSESALSAGEITKALAIDGVDVRRSAVKAACEELLQTGKVFGEPKRFWRNDDWRTGTAYHRRPRPEFDDDPFELIDRRMP